MNLSRRQFAWSALTVLLIAACFQLTFIRRSSFWTHNDTYYSLFDDAMVSMRYAKNLAEGYGLVWNPGEKPVEGYTNFLWTIYLSALHHLPVSEAKLARLVMFSGMLILLGLIASTGWLAYLLSRNFQATLISMFAVATFYPLAFWTLRGMEVGLVALLMVGSVIAVHKKKPLTLGILLAALWLTRPDTLLFSGLVLLFLLIRERQAFQQWLVPGACLALSVFTLTVFRKLTYGEFVPNTYFLKMGGASLLIRWSTGLEHLGNSLWLLAPLSLIGLFALNRRSPFRWLLFVIFFFQCLYSVHTGGDAWEWMNLTNRYIAVAAPGLCILFALALARIPQRSFLAFTVLASLTWVNIEAFTHWTRYNFHHYYNDLQKVDAGLRIRYETDPSATIAVVWAGALPYFADRTAIDILGKNDPVIAKGPAQKVPFYAGHMKWDYRYSVGELKPDVVTSVWQDSMEIKEYLQSIGYTPGYGRLWLKKDSPLVSQSLQREPLKNPLGYHPDHHHNPSPNVG